MSKIHVKHDKPCIFDFNSVVNIELLRNPIGAHVHSNKQKTARNIDA